MNKKELAAIKAQTAQAQAKLYRVMIEVVNVAKEKNYTLEQVEAAFRKDDSGRGDVEERIRLLREIWRESNV